MMLLIILGTLYLAILIFITRRAIINNRQQIRSEIRKWHRIGTDYGTRTLGKLKFPGNAQKRDQKISRS